MQTQIEKLRADFDKGRKHTIFSAMKRLGIGALHQRCNELKERGYGSEARSD